MTQIYYQKSDIENYIEHNIKYCNSLDEGKLSSFILSENNWMERRKCASGEELGINVRPGDVCYLDYGRAYLNEAGYQHFGLIMAISSCKALIIPMTSNRKTYNKAYNPYENPHGKRNLYQLGKLPGMSRESVLFLNDARFINTARVIKIMAHLDTGDKRFSDIQNRLKSILFQS